MQYGSKVVAIEAKRGDRKRREGKKRIVTHTRTHTLSLYLSHTQSHTLSLTLTQLTHTAGSPTSL